jgi:hypothetical protein
MRCRFSVGFRSLNLSALQKSHKNQTKESEIVTSSNRKDGNGVLCFSFALLAQKLNWVLKGGVVFQCLEVFSDRNERESDHYWIEQCR